MRLKSIYILLTIILLQCSMDARIISVSTSSALKTACTSAQPGDTIEAANGVYNNTGSITLTAKGTAEMPILIRAKSIGMAQLTGNSYFDFRQCEYITVEGFLITSTQATVFKLQACNNVRITRNTLRLVETSSLKWILIGGVWNDPNAMSHHNRIDHNLFENKSMAGNYITIDGSGEPTYKSSQYDRIDHNHFRNIGPRIVNEMETIRVGWSEMSLSSGFTTVEYNLFENCDGDPEIISVKTCDNIVRYNTFVSSQGTLSIRHGNRTSVYGNFFFGGGKEGTGGIRFYGDDHKIYNNYFEGLTGTVWDAALTITNGDADAGSTSLSKHFRPRNAVIAHNTFVNNKHNIEIGYTNNGSYSKPPSGNKIVNNIVYGSENELVKIITQPQSMTWESNIMFPAGTATLGISATSQQIRQTDPLFTMQDSLWTLTAGSPAVDSSTGTYSFVTDDIYGRQRTGIKDIGAEEYSSGAVIRKPLTAADVGPYAEETIITSNGNDNNDAGLPDEFVLYQNYPNPFNPETVIRFNLPIAAHTTLKVYDVTGNEVQTLINGQTEAGLHSVTFSAKTLPSGIYFYRLNSGTYSSVRKLIVLR